MSRKPDLLHPFRTTHTEHPMKGESTAKPTQRQRDKKQTRDRIEQIMAQRAFEKEWGES
ncbi:hypothetical protein [Vibrio parahaemolyticus]